MDAVGKRLVVYGGVNQNIAELRSSLIGLKLLGFQCFTLQMDAAGKRLGVYGGVDQNIEHRTLSAVCRLF